jgi:hypothetical protein
MMGVFVGAETLNEALSDGSEDVALIEGPLTMDLLARMPARVYPNPFTNNFMLEVSAFEGDRNFRVELFDLSGKMVKAFSTYAVPEGSRINLELEPGNIVPGVYLLRIIEGDKTENFRVVKQ